MASIAQALSAIAAMPDQKAKTDGYRSLLAGLLAKESVEECNAFVDHSK